MNSRSLRSALLIWALACFPAGLHPQPLILLAPPDLDAGEARVEVGGVPTRVEPGDELPRRGGARYRVLSLRSASVRVLDFKERRIEEVFAPTGSTTRTPRMVQALGIPAARVIALLADGAERMALIDAGGRTYPVRAGEPLEIGTSRPLLVASIDDSGVTLRDSASGRTRVLPWAPPQPLAPDALPIDFWIDRRRAAAEGSAEQAEADGVLRRRAQAAAQALLARLRGPWSLAMHGVVDTLAALGDLAAPELVHALSDPAFQVRQGAILALARRGGAAYRREWIRLLSDHIPFVQALASQALRKDAGLRPEDLLPLPSTGFPARLLKLLANGPPPRKPPPELARWAADGDPFVRTVARLARHATGLPDQDDLVMKDLGDADPFTALLTEEAVRFMLPASRWLAPRLATSLSTSREPLPAEAWFHRAVLLSRLAPGPESPWRELTPVLSRGLSAPDPVRRRCALACLSRIGAAAAPLVPDLLDLAARPTADGALAGRCLRSCGNSIEKELVEEMAGTRRERRLGALAASERIPLSARGCQELARQLSDPDGEIARHAARALALQKGGAAIDPDRVLDRIALFTAERWNTAARSLVAEAFRRRPARIRSLVAGLDSPSPDTGLVDLFGAIGPLAAAPLEEALARPGLAAEPQRALAAALARSLSGDAIQLARKVRQGPAAVRRAMLDVLGRQVPDCRGAVDLLVSTLADPDPDVRGAALQALSNAGPLPARARIALIEGVRSERLGLPDVIDTLVAGRASPIETLALLRWAGRPVSSMMFRLIAGAGFASPASPRPESSRVTELLYHMDVSPLASIEVVTGLGALGSAAALAGPRLLEVLEDAAYPARYRAAAARALRAICQGPSTDSALQVRLADTDPLVRLTCAVLLCRTEGGADGAARVLLEGLAPRFKPGEHPPFALEGLEEQDLLRVWPAARAVAGWLGDDSPIRRSVAAAVLRQTGAGAQAAAQELAALLEDDRPDVRDCGASLALEVDIPGAAAALERRLDRGGQEAVSAAAVLLARGDSWSTIPRVVRRIHDPRLLGQVFRHFCNQMNYESPIPGGYLQNAPWPSLEMAQAEVARMAFELLARE